MSIYSLVEYGYNVLYVSYLRRFIIKRAVELKNAENFVNIEGIFNGGNQEWFNSAESAYRHGKPGGCGVVTMADMITYMASENPAMYGKLAPFDSRSITKKEYVSFMESIYEVRRPMSNPIFFVSREMTGTLGIPFPFMMKKGFLRYADKAGGVKLKTKVLSNASFSKSVKFIKEALNRNNPVGMVVWGNKKLEKFEYHWMTIIGIYKIVASGKTMVKIATWGTIHELCLEDLYYSPSKIRMLGLITFV